MMQLGNFACKSCIIKIYDYIFSYSNVYMNALSQFSHIFNFSI